jgi:hypothetical protein
MARVYKSEAHVKDEVKKILKKHQWFFWMPPSNAFGRTGISDFNALREHVFLVVETKFGKNTPTPMQKAFCQSILKEGGFAFCVNDTNIEWFRTWCEKFDAATAGVAKDRKIEDEDGATLLEAVRILTEDFV